MTAIEKVARAVVAHMRTIDPTMTSWDEATDDMRKFMHDLASAAIEALREPDGAMGAVMEYYGVWWIGTFWEKMIDAALVEEPK